MPLTHEEIAEFIGSTRETVTRTLSDFRSRNLVTLKGFNADDREPDGTGECFRDRLAA